MKTIRSTFTEFTLQKPEVAAAHAIYNGQYEHFEGADMTLTFYLFHQA